jgi:ribosomal protein S18 acetylase RimI-like enzyme
LVERTSPGDPLAGERFLAGATASGIDVSRMWASIDRFDEVRHVCLAVVGAGRTAMVFVTSPSDGEEREELGAVIRAACDGIDDAILAQALLDVGSERMESSLVLGGFRRLTRLLYLKRALAKKDATLWDGSWPEGVTVEPYGSAKAGELERALERTYLDTEDCPELCGMRTTTDVVASHRSIGKWDPSLWTIVRFRGSAEGAFLLNPCPEQGVVELVYLGLSPALRGTGLGSRVLSWGLGRLADRPERTIMCAVDERNMAARRVYERMGFREFDARSAMVRSVGRAARS